MELNQIPDLKKFISESFFETEIIDVSNLLNYDILTQIGRNKSVKDYASALVEFARKKNKIDELLKKVDFKEPEKIAQTNISKQTNNINLNIEKNEISFTLIVDIVGYSKKFDVEQFSNIQSLFQEFINIGIINHIDKNEFIIISTGDGFILSFFDFKYSLKPLEIAVALQKIIVSKKLNYELKFGIHSAGNYIIIDNTGLLPKNIIGPGINTSTRIADAAKPSQILLSSTYVDVCNLTKNSEHSKYLIKLQKPVEDKHKFIYEVFEYKI